MMETFASSSPERSVSVRKRLVRKRDILLGRVLNTAVRMKAPGTRRGQIHQIEHAFHRQNMDAFNHYMQIAANTDTMP